jgi:hypothetical protein
MEPGKGRAPVNALQHLWARLEGLLSADEIARMKRQYAEDAARDQQRSKYRMWSRREQEALGLLHMYQLEPPETAKEAAMVEAAERKLERAQKWLSSHLDWA